MDYLCILRFDCLSALAVLIGNRENLHWSLRPRGRRPA